VNISVVLLCLCLSLLAAASAMLFLSAYRQPKQRGRKRGTTFIDDAGHAFWVGDNEPIKLPIYSGEIDHWMYKPGVRFAYLIPDPNAEMPHFDTLVPAWWAGDCWRVVEVYLQTGKHTISGVTYGLQAALDILGEDTWTTF